MSTGQLPLSSPSFLDIARLRTGLSLVWCAKRKQEQKNFQTPVKKKGRCPCQKSQTQTNKHKEHNGLGTDKMSVRLSEKIKKTQPMTGKSFIWPTGPVFVPFDIKENQAETNTRSLDSESVSSCVSMSSPLWTHLQEGMKEPALWRPYSQVPHLQWAHRWGGRRKEGKRNGWGK